MKINKIFRYFLFFLIFSLLHSCIDTDKKEDSLTGSRSAQSQITGMIKSSSVQPGTLSAVNISQMIIPEGVKVEAISIGNTGNQIDKKEISPDSDGKFSIELNLNQNGGKLVVMASAKGYITGIRTITYTKPEEVSKLNLLINIFPVAEKIVNIPPTGDILKLSFTKKADGTIDIVEGDNTTGNTPLMEVALPVSIFNTQTNRIKISYRDFLPSYPGDYDIFPGEETVNGEKLVSFGFYWLDIKDADTNETPFNTQSISTQIAKKELGEYFRVLRNVDCKQLRKIKQALGTLDEDPAKSGIQFTFWAFNWETGVWMEAGQGVFVSSGNSSEVKYFEYGENLDTVDTVWDYIMKNGCIEDNPCDFANPTSSACVDVNGDGTPEDVSCSGNFVITDENEICPGSDNKTYAVISDTNPSLTWKNLDYVKPAKETVTCEVTITDQNGNLFPTWVEAYGDCIEDIRAYTSASEGKVTLSTLKYCEPAKGRIRYYDPDKGQFIEYDNGNPVTFGPDCKVNITANSKLCLVEGFVKRKDNGEYLPYVLVLVSDKPIGSEYSKSNVYSEGLTDFSGKYMIFVPCNKDLYVCNFPFGNSYCLKFNVNNIINDDEISDENKTAILKDLDIDMLF